MMTLKIAWKNVWRHPVRSLVVMTSIALGMWAGIFLFAFSFGMYEHRIDEAISTEVSNIQIHDSLYVKDREVIYAIPAYDSLSTEISGIPGVSGVSSRLVSMGMIGSARSSLGIKVVGIDAAEENSVTQLSTKLVQGKMLEGTKRNPIVISARLAEKLRVKLKSTVVLTLQDSMGEVTSGAFKITGLYRTNNSRFDEMNVYVKRQDFGKLLGISSSVHEIAIKLSDNRLSDSTKVLIKAAHPQLLVQTWGNLMPEMEFALDMMDQSLAVIIFIILLALAFGIVNTMQMAVLERVKELGMLMAIGMNRTKIFFMIMYETMFLTIVGVPVGLLLGYSSIAYTGKVGIDLSFYAGALSSYGFDSMVYPSAGMEYYVQILIQVVIVAFLASIFPARRALKLNPVEAIRSK